MKYNEEGSGFMFVMARVLSQMIILVNTSLLIGIFLAGLITFGLCWPNKMKKKLFYGPSKNKKDETAKDFKISTIQEEIDEMKSTMKNMAKKQDDLMKAMITNQAQFADIIALLKESQGKT